MEANELTFDLKYAPWLCASDDHTRPIITGVYCDPKGWMVATDTTCLVATPAEVGEALHGAIIPAAFLQRVHQFRPVDRRAKTLTVVGSGLETNDGQTTGFIEARTKFGWLRAELIRGQFPRWRRVITLPKEPPTPVDAWERPLVSVNLRLLEKAAKSLGLRNGYIQYLPQGQGKPLIVTARECSGLSSTSILPGFGIVIPGTVNDCDVEAWRAAAAQMEQITA